MYNNFSYLIGLLLIFSFCSVPVKKEKCISFYDLDKVALNEGAVIYIEAGTYKDLSCKLKNKNFTKQVVIKPKKKGKVIIQGNSLLKLENCSNIKLEGFQFKNVAESTIVLSNSNNISIHNNFFNECGSYPTHAIIRMVNKVYNNTISNNTFNKSKAMCIAMFTKNISPIDSLNKNNLIYRNIFSNIASVKDAYPNAKTTNGMEAIMLGTGVGATLNYNLDNKVIENLFINIIGDRQEIISNKTSGNKILRNSFVNNLSGLTLRSGNNVLVKDNYFKKTKRGIRVFGENHIIENNFIEGADYAFRLPRTNSSKKVKYLEKGYQQQQKVAIINNKVLGINKAVINFNEGNSDFYAEDINFNQNTLYLKSKIKPVVYPSSRNKIDEYNNIIYNTVEEDFVFNKWISSFKSYKSYLSIEDKGCLWQKVELKLETYKN
ncbi:hypothetical protein LPB136_06565 [Tenacibaculum todarodis]|uniref:Right handed beta helix domain-containing protein n=1 Tax=Tenacibaculum todarodis TaxID=1850252 RepID=A0A1L3JIS3_9FLAO|nr:chondroitinase-B domain-containing protein [Tenacibaculum todarodis]APG65040.1 hypothetical protein LPB136_06565 [Tenacibaculum todarodis]